LKCGTRHNRAEHECHVRTGEVDDMLGALHAAAGERLARAFAPRSQGPLQTAIRSLAKFARHVPGRQLFKESRHDGDRAASTHNEWTLILLVEWFMSRTSKKTGRPLTASTIEAYISLLKGYLTFSYNFEMPDKSPRLTRLVRLLREEDPLGGVRRKRRAWRRHHLRKLWKQSAAAREATPAATTKWAALAAAWHVLARGGELCPSGRWCAHRHPTRADLVFKGTKVGERYVVLWLRPLKKKGTGVQPKVPQYILEADGGGSDAYKHLRRMVDVDPVPHRLQASTPMFRLRSKTGAWTHMTVAHLREFTRECAAQLGYTERKQWGAHSARIGGATDLASTGKASQLLLQAKGRWASDIGKIYARMTRRNQLAASRLMQRAKGRDLEDLIPGYVQAA
jgi:hypothetical protein